MKKSEKKVLPFPLPKEAISTTIICQIGDQRFAFHWEIEDLPPAPSLLVLQPPPKNAKCRSDPAPEN